jgi:hypothetical protein
MLNSLCWLNRHVPKHLVTAATRMPCEITRWRPLNSVTSSQQPYSRRLTATRAQTRWLVHDQAQTAGCRKERQRAELRVGRRGAEPCAVCVTLSPTPPPMRRREDAGLTDAISAVRPACPSRSYPFQQQPCAQARQLAVFDAYPPHRRVRHRAPRPVAGVVRQKPSRGLAWRLSCRHQPARCSAAPRPRREAVGGMQRHPHCASHPQPSRAQHHRPRVWPNRPYRVL